MLAPTILILLFYTDSIISASPPRRATPPDCVYMGNFQPSWARSRVLNSEISPRPARPPLIGLACQGVVAP